MMASTHLAFGLFSATGLFALFSQSLHRELPAVGAVILGALLPDLDTPQSALGRLLPFLSIPLERRWGHRTLTHSLLAVAGLALLGLPLWGYYRASVYAALLLGYLSHLLADCATKSGVPLFYPHPLQCVLPGNPRYRVTTGSLAERGLLLGLLLFLGLFFPLSSLGGVWQAVRYLLATQPAAYRDYRDATTEVQLVFRGRWQHSRQPVAGQARILEGSPSQFLLWFDGAVWVYGEAGDIQPDHSRVRATPQPVRWDTLRVVEQPWAEVVAQLPPHTLITGRLDSDRPFILAVPQEEAAGQHTAVRLTTTRVELTYASPAQLAQLAPVHRPPPERQAQLEQQLADRQQALQALHLRRPPVPYLQLQEAEAALQALRRQLAALQEAGLRFTGRLPRRHLGEHP